MGHPLNTRLPPPAASQLPPNWFIFYRFFPSRSFYSVGCCRCTPLLPSLFTTHLFYLLFSHRFFSLPLSLLSSSPLPILPFLLLSSLSLSQLLLIDVVSRNEPSCSKLNLYFDWCKKRLERCQIRFPPAPFSFILFLLAYSLPNYLSLPPKQQQGM